MLTLITYFKFIKINELPIPNNYPFFIINLHNFKNPKSKTHEESQTRSNLQEFSQKQADNLEASELRDTLYSLLTSTLSGLRWTFPRRVHQDFPLDDRVATAKISINPWPCLERRAPYAPAAIRAAKSPPRRWIETRWGVAGPGINPVWQPIISKTAPPRLYPWLEEPAETVVLGLHPLF